MKKVIKKGKSAKGGPASGGEIKKIIVAGEGGQGVQTIAKLLNAAAYEKGFKVAYIPNYGVEQRGGVSVAFVQIQNQPIIYPKFQFGDLVVILSERSVERTWRYVGPETIVIYNSSYIPPKMIKAQKAKAFKLIPIDASNLAAEKLKNPRVFNTIILGAILGRLDKITFSEMKKSLNKKFKDKYKAKPKLENSNNEALKMGMELVK